MERRRKSPLNFFTYKGRVWTTDSRGNEDELEKWQQLWKVMDSGGVVVSGCRLEMQWGRGWSFWFREMEDDALGGEDPVLLIFESPVPSMDGAWLKVKLNQYPLKE